MLIVLPCAPLSMRCSLHNKFCPHSKCPEDKPTSLKIYRKGISKGAWTIKYTIRAGTSGTATAGTNSTTTGILSPATADFISVAAGTVTFAHGEAGPLVIPIDIVTIKYSVVTRSRHIN